jgi:hypothetical protein
MHIRLAHSLGAELGTNYLSVTLIPECMMLPGVAFEHVELVLPEPLIGGDCVNPLCSPTQRTHTHDLQGVMNTYAMLQRDLEAAAIALVGPTKDEEISIRDRIAQESGHYRARATSYWHLEVSKNRRVGVERCVRHTGVRSWAYHCGGCVWNSPSRHALLCPPRYTIYFSVASPGWRSGLHLQRDWRDGAESERGVP